MKTNYTTKELKTQLRQGEFAWPGGYPLFFITTDGAALSFKAVRENLRLVMDSIKRDLRDGWQVCAVDVNYEDPTLFCDHTGERIPSAYAEDLAEV